VLRDTVAHLDAWGLLENTILCVTADHGEAFGEHGILGHGRQLYDELVRVPLVLVGPPPFEGGRVITGGVGLLDVLPTFFDHAGLVPPSPIHGRSALPLVARTALGRVVVSEERINRDNTAEDRKEVLVSLRSARWKAILTYDQRGGTVREELYDLDADPTEQDDLAADVGWIDASVELDLAFCVALEKARDRIWQAVSDADRRVNTPYGAGITRVKTRRPPSCLPGGE
jgi:arylsulfatase A-like enzyme